MPRGNTVNNEIELVEGPIRTVEGNAGVSDVMDRRPSSFHPGSRLDTFSTRGGRSFDTKYPTTPNIWPYRKVVSQSIYYL